MSDHYFSHDYVGGDDGLERDGTRYLALIELLPCGDRQRTQRWEIIHWADAALTARQTMAWCSQSGLGVRRPIRIVEAYRLGDVEAMLRGDDTRSPDVNHH